MKIIVYLQQGDGGYHDSNLMMFQFVSSAPFCAERVITAIISDPCKQACKRFGINLVCACDAIEGIRKLGDGPCVFGTT